MHIQVSSHSSTSRVYKPSCRRSPISPSSVLPPSISAQNSSATKHEAGSLTNQNRKATALLSKVASTPGPRRCNAASAPLPSPPARESEHRQLDSLENSPTEDGQWPMREKRDGYVSFPDFELYQQSFDSQDYADGQSQYDQS